MNAETFQKIIDELRGTPDSLETVAEKYGMDPFMTEGLTEFVDSQIFCCTVCGWWHDQSEEASADYGLDEWTCTECCEEMAG